MTGPGDVQLVVQGDDFGMCHAVDAGVVVAFTDGILTQASTMAPCPWADEALGLAGRHRIALGLHQTLTSEWDHLRWGPITRAASLRGPDGTFRRTVVDAAAHLDVDEAVAELLAQADRVTGAGAELGYLDVHMGLVSIAAYEQVSARLGLPFLYPGLGSSLPFASIGSLSARDAPDKKRWLLGRLDRMGPGVHLVVSHPAVASPELDALTLPDHPDVRWATEYRVSDLAVLVDPEVRRAVEARGIVLTSVADADFAADPPAVAAAVDPPPSGGPRP